MYFFRSIFNFFSQLFKKEIVQSYFGCTQRTWHAIEGKGRIILIGCFMQLSLLFFGKATVNFLEKGLIT
ncbi:unnamed protein product [Paramecium sonneborni]|uniref:Uncharacterized protein n=1 Tax=Paramecium sonneborni TaxID=65129 RepID=A0A8S1R749_9CILI|nr:unnamed protein product [Paramecium sonneborni]